MNISIVIPFEVIERFAARNGVALTVASSIHEDLLAYLDDTVSNEVSPMPLVDEAWHSFICHTIEYEQFCMARYGCFIHHVPFGMKRDVYANKVNILLAQNSTPVAACQSCNSCGVIEYDRSPNEVQAQQSNEETTDGCKHCGGYPKTTEVQEVNTVATADL